MIYDAIERIGDELEDIAVMMHTPQKAVYVVILEDGSHKIMDEKKFGYNSKYSFWDFWSVLLSMNQPVDKKKVIQSNNKYSFFVKDFKKLTDEIIDEYYEKTGLQYSEMWIKEWIKKNVNSFDNYKGNELVKFFFYARPEDYRECGRNYLVDKCMRNTAEYNGTELGSGVGTVENAKKPFFENKTRKTVYRERVDITMAYKKALFFNMLKSCVRIGKNYVYVTEEGKICLCNVDTRPDINVSGSILFVVRFDEKGNLVFDCAEPVM